MIGAILGIGPDDLVLPQGIPLIQAILANPSLGPLPAVCKLLLQAGCVLTKEAASEIRGG